MTTAESTERPTVKLVGLDGNAFAILARCQKALRKAGRADEVTAFVDEATAGDYSHLLVVAMKWFEVE